MFEGNRSTLLSYIRFSAKLASVSPAPHVATPPKQPKSHYCASYLTSVHNILTEKSFPHTKSSTGGTLSCASPGRAREKTKKQPSDISWAGGCPHALHYDATNSCTRRFCFALCLEFSHSMPTMSEHVGAMAHPLCTRAIMRPLASATNIISLHPFGVNSLCKKWPTRYCTLQFLHEQSMATPVHKHELKYIRQIHTDYKKCIIVT